MHICAYVHMYDFCIHIYHHAQECTEDPEAKKGKNIECVPCAWYAHCHVLH